jgi:hypothetical protein
MIHGTKSFAIELPRSNVWAQWAVAQGQGAAKPCARPRPATRPMNRPIKNIARSNTPRTERDVSAKVTGALHRPHSATGHRRDSLNHPNTPWLRYEHTSCFPPTQRAAHRRARAAGPGVSVAPVAHAASAPREAAGAAGGGGWAGWRANRIPWASPPAARKSTARCEKQRCKAAAAAGAGGQGFEAAARRCAGPNRGRGGA